MTELTSRPSFLVTLRMYTSAIALPNSSSLTTPRTVSTLLLRIAAISAFLSSTFPFVVLPGFEDCSRDVNAAGVIARIIFELFAESRREEPVGRVVQLCGIPACGQDPQRLIAHIAKHGFIERGHTADDGHLFLEPVFDELP